MTKTEDKVMYLKQKLDEDELNSFVKKISDDLKSHKQAN